VDCLIIGCIHGYNVQKQICSHTSGLISLAGLPGHFHQCQKSYSPEHLNRGALLAATPRNSTKGCEQGIRCRRKSPLQQHVQN
jgi:hypothetical protein